MSGRRIGALNQGLQIFRQELLKDSLGQQRVEIAIVTFGAGVQVVQNFATVDNFSPPPLQAQGLTPSSPPLQFMGERFGG